MMEISSVGSSSQPGPLLVDNGINVFSNDMGLDSIVDAGLRDKLLRIAIQTAVNKDDAITENDIETLRMVLERNCNVVMDVKYIAVHTLMALSFNQTPAIRNLISGLVPHLTRFETEDCVLPVQSIISYSQWYVRKSFHRATLIATSLDRNTMRADDFDNYIMDNYLPMIEEVLDNDSLRTCYLVMASTGAFFPLDPLKRGKLNIKDLVCSTVLEELDESMLITKEQGEANPYGNWFSPYHLVHMHLDYRNCNVSKSGMLTEEEMCLINGGMFNPIFIRGVFSSQMTYIKDADGEVVVSPSASDTSVRSTTGQIRLLDFQGFCNFSRAVFRISSMGLPLTLEEQKIVDKTEPSCIKYIFDCLDEGRTGYLTRPVIERLVTEIVSLSGLSPDVLPADLADQIFDMIRPADFEKGICLQDLLHNSRANCALGILIDANQAYKYENKGDESDGP